MQGFPGWRKKKYGIAYQIYRKNYERKGLPSNQPEWRLGTWMSAAANQ